MKTLFTEQYCRRPGSAFEQQTGLHNAVGQRIRARVESAPGDSLRLLALTGYGQEEDRRRAHEAGFEHHLVKPIDIDRLFEIVGG